VCPLAHRVFVAVMNENKLKIKFLMAKPIWNIRTGSARTLLNNQPIEPLQVVFVYQVGR